MAAKDDANFHRFPPFQRIAALRLARLDLDYVFQWCKLNPMAVVDIERILKEAKALPESDRARLAQELVATLDGPADPDAAAAWDSELEKRLSDLRSGNAELLSREEFNRRLD